MDYLQNKFSDVCALIHFASKHFTLFHPKMNILNESINGSQQVSTTTMNNTNIDASLQLMILRLKGKYLSDNGKSVDYIGLKKDKLFQEFECLANQLSNVDLSKFNAVQRKVFFINIYNTLTIHGLCKCDPLPKSVVDVANFWKSTAYNINGLIFSLDDVEHGILRANTRHPLSMLKPFGDGDPRLKYSMDKPLDPRIHFVLNCGAKSCPAIGVYKENNLESALESAASSFLGDSVQIMGKTIHLSKILSWYQSDFGTNEKAMLRWISRYLPDDEKEEIEILVKSQQFNVVYDEYNWLINSSEDSNLK